MKSQLYNQLEELTEREALAFWDAWIDAHPEHKEIIDEQLAVIEQNFKKLKADASIIGKTASFGRGQAAVILYRIIEKGFFMSEAEAARERVAK